MEQQNDNGQPGNIYAELTGGMDAAKNIEVHPAGGKTFEEYTSERVGHYFDADRIPDHILIRVKTRDVRLISPNDMENTAEFSNKNLEYIRRYGTEDERATLVGAAYCIENGIPHGSFRATPLALYLDDRFRFYRAVNDNSHRNTYALFTAQKKDELLERINADRPDARMTGLPAVGRVPAYSPEWAKGQFGNKEANKIKDDELKPRYKQNGQDTNDDNKPERKIVHRLPGENRTKTRKR